MPILRSFGQLMTKVTGSMLINVPLDSYRIVHFDPRLVRRIDPTSDFPFCCVAEAESQGSLNNLAAANIR